MIRTSRHQGLLGTVVEFRIDDADVESAPNAEALAVAEMQRLEAIFSVYDANSELRRWMRGSGDPGPELTTVLQEASVWFYRSGGAFNPAMRGLNRLWRTSTELGRRPDDSLLSAEVAKTRPLPYEIDDGEVTVVGTLDGLDLNAIAKGWIVDRAGTALADAGLTSFTINAGGDILHRGPDPISVGIENPQRPYDNEPPLLIATVSSALATSGGSRRYWEIGGRRHSHVVDPRSGQPVDLIASASVIAVDAATADVLATIATVLEPDEALAFTERFDAGSCLIGSDGVIHRSPTWMAAEISS